MNPLALLLIFGAVAMRVARHFGIIDLPPNFAPISAMALFSAVNLPKKQAIIIPIAAMFISDLFIGFYNPGTMFFVYLSFLLVIILGLYIKQNKTVFNIIGGSLIASVMFYLITNFAVWVFSGYYPQTLAGLEQCYILAIPFFRYTLLGDLFYVMLLFGIYKLAIYLSLYAKTKMINAKC